jgi:glycerol-3-phosphate dehydrogenase
LFLDARAAYESAGVVAQLMAQELGFDREWETKQAATFRKAASAYIWDEV